MKRFTVYLPTLYMEISQGCKTVYRGGALEYIRNCKTVQIIQENRN